MIDENKEPCIQFLIIVPRSLGDTCLAVPAVRAILEEVGGENVTVLCERALAKVWEREVSQIIVIEGKRVFHSFKEYYEQYPKAVVIALNDEPVTSYPYALDNFFVINKETANAVGMLCPFENERRNQHRVERFLSVPKVFSFNTREFRYYPIFKEKPLSGLIAIQAESEYGRSYHQGLTLFPQCLGEKPELGKVLICQYDRNEFQVTGKLSPIKIRELDTERSLTQDIILEMEGMDCFISPESDLIHLAAYLGVPTVAVFGPGHVTETRPLGVFHQVLSQKVPCQPCMVSECVMDSRCLQKISIKQIDEAVSTLFNEFYSYGSSLPSS